MNYKLTIDKNLMHEGSTIPAMDTLKRWRTEGKIELIEAEPPKVEVTTAYDWPGAPLRPAAPVRDSRAWSRARVKKEPPGGLSFKMVASVLFPLRDSQKLDMGEINDVVHLVKHHFRKNELFITHNIEGFIEGGKRESLRASFGIVAMTPDEAVLSLSKKAMNYAKLLNGCH